MEKLVKEGLRMRETGEVLNYSQYKNKLGSKLKDYLNAAELNDFFFLSMSGAAMEAFLAGQVERGNITKDEHRNLKSASTYMKNFLNLYMDRLSDKQLEELRNRSSKGFEVKILDYYTLSRLDRRYSSLMEEAMSLPREELFDLFDLTISYNCNQCTKCHSDCRLYDILRNNFVPAIDGENSECPYKFDIANKFTNHRAAYISYTDKLIEKQIGDLKSDISDLETKLTKARFDSEISSVEISELEDTNSKLREDNAKLLEEIEVLKNSLDDSFEQI